MQPKRDLAIILRSIPYEERHRVVTALTENHGQLTALARNSIQSRRFGGSLELFAASEWSFTERASGDLANLTEAQIRRSYEGLRNDFQKLSLASVFSEIMLRLAPRHEACPDLFRLHSNALALLEELAPGASEPIILPLLNAYVAKLLQWSGSQPQLGHCSGCEIRLESIADDQPVNCIVADAGWICANCRTGATRHIRERQGGLFQYTLLRVSARAIRDFQRSLSLPIRQATQLVECTREEHEELYQFLEALMVYHLPGFDREPIKGLRFLGLKSSLRPLATNPR